MSILVMVFSPGFNTASAATAAWKTVGSAGFSADQVADISLYVYNGTPYVAYDDWSNSQKATVMRYTGNAWETVGSAGFSAGAAYYTSLYVYNGTPYVAYMDLDNGNKATAMKYNGSAWETVGSAGFSADQADFTSLYVYDGTPYVAYRDVGNSSKATVMKYNGSAWETVGSAGFSAGAAYKNSLYVYNGTPYLAYRDFGNSRKATVMRYNGSAWETVGSAGFSAGEADDTSLTVYNGTPYVAYQDGANDSKATVMKYNGSAWVTVGSAGFSAGQADYTSLTVYNGTPYVAYEDYGNSRKATVMKYNGSAWVTVGSAGFSGDGAHSTSLYVYDGTPYVAYRDVGNSSKATVMAYINSYTVTFNSNGGSSVSPVTQDSGTAIASSPTPTKTGYTFAGWYSDEALSSAVSFPYTITSSVTLYAKWTANPYTVTFSTDGGDALAPVTQDYGTTIASSPTPTKTGYTFAGWYSDEALSSAVSFPYTITADVTLYAKWTANPYTVTFSTDGGDALAPVTQDYGTTIASSPTPTKTGYTFAGWYSDEALSSAVSFPYTITADVTLYAKWTANPYTVTFSTDGGDALAPVTQDYGTTIASSPTPTKSGYTFAGWYSDSALTSVVSFPYTITGDVTLYAKWMAWKNVGSPGFSAGQADFTSLYVYNGTPYVAYKDVDSSNKATVMRYTGSAWEPVGSVGFSAGEVGYTSLYMYGGTPYVAYQDGANSYKATVMKYNGSAWETVGSAGFSESYAYYTSLYVDNGTPYVAYQDWSNSHSQKVTVKKFDGSAWVTVGDACFSTGEADYTSLYVDNGTPYVAYRDIANGYKATVMKYNGSSWEAVGSAGLSAGQADFTSLYIYNGTPYLAYGDGDSGSYATVMKYNGSAWETVGSAGFSAGTVYYTSLYMYNGTPYVAFEDVDSQKATVMKYNGSMWETVGSACFSADDAWYTSLYVYDGTPYVAYMDLGNSNKATVMRYLGGSCTVTFDSNGGSTVDSITQDSGTTIADSPTTTKTGYNFAGWYSDSALTSAVSFPYTITTEVTLYAKWTTTDPGSSDNDGTTPSRTITVTDTSSLFSGTNGQIKAAANMTNAFSDSVEVKIADFELDDSDFVGLRIGNMAYPFDISLFDKGTGTKTEPNSGYAVTLTLPVPNILLDEKSQLSIIHVSDDGTFTTLASQLKQIDGVWYIVFEATEFSPYALVVNHIGAYDETAGLPYYVDSAGNTVFIGFAADGEYIAPSGVAVLFKANAKSFTDTESHWAKDDIGFVTERELFTGTGDNLFSPDAGMTRAMFATVIGRLYERSYGAIEASSDHAFTDCDYDAYYGKYVDWAAEEGIIGGYGNGAFGPNDQVTREQMAAILYRFTEFLGAFPSNTGTALSYPDADAISDWAKNAALYCQSTGIITGRDGGSFVPQGMAKRAEVAAILERFIKNTLV